jgi:hypothetical protein
MSHVEVEKRFGLFGYIMDRENIPLNINLKFSKAELNKMLTVHDILDGAIKKLQKHFSEEDMWIEHEDLMMASAYLYGVLDRHTYMDWREHK